MKGLKKKNKTKTHPNQGTKHKPKPKKPTQKPKPEKTIHTQNPMNPKLYKKGPPKLKNLMTDKRHKSLVFYYQ